MPRIKTLLLRKSPAERTAQSLSLVLLTLTLQSFLGSSPAIPATITVDPTISHQTMVGWEATAYVGDAPGHSVSFPLFLDDLYAYAVSDLGIDRLRLELGSGHENPTDYGALWLAGQISEAEYFHSPGYRYQIVNDNGDPFLADPNGFFFTALDFKIENIVLPLKDRLEARGESLYINLCYVDFKSSTFEHFSDPEEYAEFILHTFQYLESSYGWVPHALEMILEPDNAPGWSPNQIGDALAATGARLEANGFNPDFIIPSTAGMGAAVSYFDQIIQRPGALAYLSELSYHRYSGVSQQNLDAIRQRALQYGIDTAMLEHIGSGVKDLFDDVIAGRNSSWSQFTLASIGGESPGAFFWIDEQDPQNPVVNMARRTKYLRQIFPFVRAGAERLEAQTNNTDFVPLAFRNSDQKHVVAIKVDTGASGATLNVQGLPAGTYGIRYTIGPTDSQEPTFFDVGLENVTIAEGEEITIQVPGSGQSTTFGVVTVYEIHPLVFADGFESGDTSAWSNALP